MQEIQTFEKAKNRDLYIIIVVFYILLAGFCSFATKEPTYFIGSIVHAISWFLTRHCMHRNIRIIVIGIIISLVFGWCIEVAMFYPEFIKTNKIDFHNYKIAFYVFSSMLGVTFGNLVRIQVAQKNRKL